MFLFTVKQRDNRENHQIVMFGCVQAHRLHRNETVFTVVSELHVEVDFSV